jgi:putative transposase
MKMVDRTNEQLSIRKQCRLLTVGRSNIYYTAKVAPDETTLANEIYDLWLDMPYYGYRKITAELRRRNYEINQKKVLRIMHDMRVQALYPRKKTSISNAQHKKYPYLLRDLAIARPDHVWATDITYIKMPQGFAYLVAIIDIYSRFVLAWKISNTMEAIFCLEALDSALKTGKRPEILNTDQGVQFTSQAWVDRVQINNIKVSMDGIGRWIDNVFIERFWRTLKHEHVLLHSFESIKAAYHSIASFIDTYNHRRLHQSLGYKTPAEVYCKI